MATFISHSVEETMAFARGLSGEARAGDVIALAGDLGAGKTHFVKGFVAGLGARANVTSPTFTLSHEYEGGRLPVYHFDFYRIASSDEVQRLGWDDYLESDGVIVVEWADRFPAIIPAHAKWIRFESEGESERRISIGNAP